MSLLLLVEDKDGPQPFKTLVRKMSRDAVTARFMPQGDMLNVDKVFEFIRLHCRSHRNVSKVFICRDSECTPIAETRQRCREAAASLARRLGPRFPPVAYVVVDHSLEGWLGSDAQALRTVLGHDAWIPRRNFEEYCRPADLMNETFTRNDRDGYEKSRDALLLAEACDPRRIAARSRTFSYFRQLVLSANP